ncbi:MAG: hypothetical protein LIO90_09045 [Bacteroidales bacterium]|nr:hypothetical protein [Bacteroidales bacterium]
MKQDTRGNKAASQAETPEIPIRGHLSTLQLKMLRLLCGAKPTSALELSNRLKCDSRSTIRYLRLQGYNIQDEKSKVKGSGHVKYYWIDPAKPFVEDSENDQ